MKLKHGEKQQPLVAFMLPDSGDPIMKTKHTYRRLGVITEKLILTPKSILYRS